MATLEKLRRCRADLMNNRAAGVRQFRDQNGEEVTYRSDLELAGALAAVEEQIAALERGRVHTVKLHTSKGR
jgi:hypothetical protein